MLLVSFVMSSKIFSEDVLLLSVLFVFCFFFVRVFSEVTGSTGTIFRHIVGICKYDVLRQNWRLRDLSFADVGHFVFETKPCMGKNGCAQDQNFLHGRRPC